MKPIKIIGNPRQTYCTYKDLREGIAETHEHLYRIVRNALEYNAMSGIRRRTYQRMLNRHAALRYAKFLKDL